MIAVLGLALHFAVAHAKTVTLTSPLAHASVVLAELGKAAGLVMKPSGSVNQDYFFVHFTNTPLDVAMQRVAKTLNATWEKGDNWSLVLTRTHKQDLENSAGSLSVRNQIAEQLDKLKITDFDAASYPKKISDALDLGKGDSLPLDKDLRRLGREGPSERFALRLLKAIGADKLARLPRMKWNWFSLDPTRRQLPLPASATIDLRRFTDEQITVQSLLNPDRVPRNAYVDWVIPSTIDFSKPFRFGLGLLRDGSFISAELFLQQGDAKQSTSVGLSPDSNSSAMSLAQGPSKDLDKELVTDEVLQSLVETGKQHYFQKGFESLRPPLLRPWHHIIESKGKTDFLTAIVDSTLRQSTQEQVIDTVALIDDRSAEHLLYQLVTSPERVTLRKQWEMITLGGGRLTIDGSDGYISIRPGNMGDGRDRVDRKLFAQMVKEAEDGSYNLDTMADFALSSPVDETISIGVNLAMFSHPYGVFSFDPFNGNFVQLLRIYGQLPKSQRDRARHGGLTLKIDSLPSALRIAVEDILFSKNISLAKDVGSRDSTNPLQLNQMENLDLSPTFSLGNRYPTGSTVTVAVELNRRIFSRLGQYRDSQVGVMTTARQAAFMIAYHGSIAAQTSNSNLLIRDPEFAIVPQVELYVEFDFPGVGSGRQRMSLPMFSSTTKFTTVDGLPDDWRLRLALMAQQIQKDFSNSAPRPKDPPPDNLMLARTNQVEGQR